MDFRRFTRSTTGSTPFQNNDGASQIPSPSSSQENTLSLSQGSVSLSQGRNESIPVLPGSPFRANIPGSPSLGGFAGHSSPNTQATNFGLGGSQPRMGVEATTFGSGGSQPRMGVGATTFGSGGSQPRMGVGATTFGLGGSQPRMSVGATTPGLFGSHAGFAQQHPGAVGFPSHDYNASPNANGGHSSQFGCRPNLGQPMGSGFGALATPVGGAVGGSLLGSLPFDVVSGMNKQLPRVAQPNAATRPITDLVGDGISFSDVQKLAANGYNTVWQVSQGLQRSLIAISGISVVKADTILKKACSLTSMGFVSGSTILQYRKETLSITTGSKRLDSALGGGLETGTITEVFGEFGSGKSQLCHTIAVTCQLPVELGGAERKCAYLDTENTFRPERISDIAQRFGMSASTTLNYIARAKPGNMDILLMYAQQAQKTLSRADI